MANVDQPWLARRVSALVCLLALSAASRAGAFSTGITTQSFSLPGGCNQCHSGGMVPTVALMGPTMVLPNSTNVYTLKISEVGIQDKGGLNVSALSGILTPGGSDSSNTKILPGTGGRNEITHTGAKDAVAGEVTFTFQWTAPGSFTSVSLDAWGNAVDGNGNSLGDQASFARLEVFPLAAMPFVFDHFKIYKAKTTKGTPKFAKLDVTLVDQFESKVTTVVKPVFLGNPVDKNEEGLFDPEIHLECYKIKDAKTDPKQPKFAGRRVRITNQFGNDTLDVKKAAELCVPSLKDEFGPPPATLPAHDVDHFKCYKAKTAKGFPKFEKRDVTLEDQFELKETTVIKLDRFCNPVDKDGGGIKDPAGHLACYKIKDAKTDPKQEKFEKTDVFTQNQFGPEQLTAAKPALLCVPSEKTDLGPIP